MKKVYSAAITPLNENGSIDIKSLERMLERNLRHGVDGFFFLGSMGEWHQFNDEEKSVLIAEASRIIGKRAEVLAAVSATSLNVSLKNMEKLSKHNPAAFVVTIPPPAYSGINHVDFVTEVADKAEKPVYFYYLPQLSGKNLSYDELKTILAHPNIKGIKNSSGSMNTRKELLMLKKSQDFKLFEGHEWAVDEAMILGCDGILVGMASLGSKIFKALAAAVDAKDFEEAMKLQYDLVNIFWGVYGRDLSTVWIGQKYALEKLGIFSNHKTLVQAESALSAQRIKEIDECLAKYRELLD